MPKKKADAKSGEWNRFVIAMRGDRITVVLNGETVIDPQTPRRAAAWPIGLQDHNDPIEFQPVSETHGLNRDEVHRCSKRQFDQRAREEV